MEKTLRIALNKYSIIPHSLRKNPHVNEAASETTVSLASLYHHYYLDSYGKLPPSPDPAQFEHVHFLLPTKDFRFQGAGLGVSPAIKRHRSNELGQAFCRWFLHDHLNITYFAHTEEILNRQLHRAFNSFRLERSAIGDTPDYFCAEDVNKVFLAEAKGRYSSVSFKTKEFAAWREQFERVVFRDPSGDPRSIKGHIVATRFATEQDGVNLKSSIWAEDPASPGERHLSPEDGRELATSVVASHYSRIATKLGQPLLAAALSSGVPLPEEILIRAITWRIVVGPLTGHCFVGGYFGVQGSNPIPRDSKGQILFDRHDPFCLDSPNATFFGVDESIFRQVVAMARTGITAAAQLSLFEATDSFYSGFSALRDGSALGPLDFFTPREPIIL